MQTLKIKPISSSIKYDPKIKGLWIISEIKFFLNKEKMEFEIDQNPYGEPKLATIQNLYCNSDFSILSFESIYRGKATKFILESNYEIDKILYKFIIQIKNNEFKNDIKDIDKIDLIFEKGKVNQFYILKDVNYEIVDSLRIIFEENDYFIIKQKPWRRYKVETILVTKNEIKCVAKDETFNFVLEAQSFVVDIIRSTLSSKNGFDIIKK